MDDQVTVAEALGVLTRDEDEVFRFRPTRRDALWFTPEDAERAAAELCSAGYPAEAVDLGSDFPRVRIPCGVGWETSFISIAKLNNRRLVMHPQAKR